MSATLEPVWYAVPWDPVGEGASERYSCPVLAIYVGEKPWFDEIARLCADDYHTHHDGWEASWPLTLVLYESEDGPEMARFTVDRVVGPVFIVKR